MRIWVNGLHREISTDFVYYVDIFYIVTDRTPNRGEVMTISYRGENSAGELTDGGGPVDLEEGMTFTAFVA